jgi:hypothetical protein
MAAPTVPDPVTQAITPSLLITVGSALELSCSSWKAPKEMS